MSLSYLLQILDRLIIVLRHHFGLTGRESKQFK